MNVRIGLVGYGAGGRLFHAPFIKAAEGCELVGIVTRDTERAALAALETPEAQVYRSLRDLLDANVNVVVLSTPPGPARPLAR